MSITVIEDFEKDLLNILQTELNDDASTDINELLIKFYNKFNNEIPLKKYKILKSKEFMQNNHTSLYQYQTILQEIENELSSGNSILYRQTNRFKKPAYVDKFNAYLGVHHLHLGKKNERTSYLLFLMFNDDTAYFIDVAPHNFSNLDILEIIHSNWPEIIERFRVHNIKNLAYDIDAIVFQKFMKLNINTLAKTKDGTIYNLWIGGGVSTNGSSMQAVRQSINFMKQLKKLRKYFADNKEDIITNIFNQTKIKYNTLRLKLIKNNGYFSIIHEKSGLLFIFF